MKVRPERTWHLAGSTGVSERRQAVKTGARSEEEPNPVTRTAAPGAVWVMEGPTTDALLSCLVPLALQTARPLWMGT